MAQLKLSETKDKQEKFWMIESAARTIQEMGRIAKDEQLMEAAKKEVDNQIAEAEAAKKMVANFNSKTPIMTS